MQSKEHSPLIDSYLLDALIANAELPKPAEQARNLLLWLGNTLKSPEDRTATSIGTIQSTIGASTAKGVAYVIEHLHAKNLISWRNPGTGQTQQIGLTFDGWEAVERLQRESTDSRIAFMAMKFNDSELDGVVADIFRPAVAETGFELHILTDNPRAGLIDDRLRVEIRQARFLIADLTHQNPGAYWEAGFAEGLGKPVIYTCKKQAFGDGVVHFDTNHHLTVMWNPEALEEAAQELKNTIRATLPDEAKMND